MLTQIATSSLFCDTMARNFNSHNITFTLQDRIAEKQISRSSMATANEIIPTLNMCPMLSEVDTPKNTPEKKTALTPKLAKENIPSIHVIPHTPKGNLFTTPNRLTRSEMKRNNNGFATPRAPLSGHKPLSRQNTIAVGTVNTPLSDVRRSKSHTHLIRVKNLPPLI